jgi:pimeloyl-ACP methyl ester carboxylesterase
VFALTFAADAHADAARTTYPVVFAHGMAGFDDILGYDYWGDDYGTFVGDPCSLFEIYCNDRIDSAQKAYVAQVQPFQSSEARGLDLANDVEGFMATAGASGVNLIGHSQGGLDIRKAARVLYERRGQTVVRVLISISSPHRGSPVAKYSATDGKVTGMRAFNQSYNVDSRYAARYASLITAQTGINVNPALYLLKEFVFDIDGDGYCVDDCDNDGAAGRGNGNAGNNDDDGLVGINSQQMGHRLQYQENMFSFDQVNTDLDRGFVGNLNAPSATQMTSSANVINQDHIDVIGVGPDTFDEMEFYAAIIDYVAYYD